MVPVCSWLPLVFAPHAAVAAAPKTSKLPMRNMGTMRIWRLLWNIIALACLAFREMVGRPES
jgi:hypothetical protein